MYKFNAFFILFCLSGLCEFNLCEDAKTDADADEDDSFMNWMFGFGIPDFDENEDKNGSLDQLKSEIKSHYGIESDGKSIFDKDEIQFHLFNIHDFDQNSLLDGLELLAALTHNDEPRLTKGRTSLAINTDLVDIILKHDDVNRDGFLDYTEFANARQKRTHRRIFAKMEPKDKLKE